LAASSGWIRVEYTKARTSSRATGTGGSGLGGYWRSMARPNSMNPLKGEQHPNAKLWEREIREIRKLWKTGKYRQSELASMYGLDRAHLFRIVKNRIWKHIKV